MRKPFFRKDRKCWYVIDGKGKFVRLDPDEKTAHLLWNGMLQRSMVTGPNVTLMAMCDSYLDEHEADYSDRKLKEVRSILAQFCLDFGELQPWHTITPGSITKWMQVPKRCYVKKDETFSERLWSASRKRDVGSLLKKMFRWCHDSGIIARNPIAGLRLPTPKPRSQLIEFDVHSTLVAKCRELPESRPFSLYLIASRCGARPQQIRDVTAKHVVTLNDGSIIWVFSEHKNEKRTQRKLTVYLSPCLQTITRILMATRMEGNLFLNSYSTPWLKDSAAQCMRRLRKKLSLPPDLVLYSYRHTFATDSLLAGVDLSTVAALLGHANSNMVSRVYGHLDQHKGHLVEAAARAHQNRMTQEFEKSEKEAAKKRRSK